MKQYERPQIKEETDELSADELDNTTAGYPESVETMEIRGIKTAQKIGQKTVEAVKKSGSDELSAEELDSIKAGMPIEDLDS